jgi:methionine synthase II (cobalamin-independent)
MKANPRQGSTGTKRSSNKFETVEVALTVRSQIITFAEIVGQDNACAGTDCSLGGRVHPQSAGQAARPARRRGDREQEALELNQK